jgi:hypothetical protein
MSNEVRHLPSRILHKDLAFARNDMPLQMFCVSPKLLGRECFFDVRLQRFIFLNAVAQ